MAVMRLGQQILQGPHGHFRTEPQRHFILFEITVDRFQTSEIRLNARNLGDNRGQIVTLNPLRDAVTVNHVVKHPILAGQQRATLQAVWRGCKAQ